MVLLSFEGPINDNNIQLFKSLLGGRYRNPNGCTIGATFFLSHKHTNYDQVQWLYSKGAEIGINSVRGESLAQAQPRQWRDELLGMRRALEKFSYVDPRRVVGVRAPGLPPAGAVQYRELKVLGFKYDSSQIVTGGPYWPQTLDHRPVWNWNCSSQLPITQSSKPGQSARDRDRCPSERYAGMWQFPVSEFDGAGAAPTDMNSPDGLYKLLVGNLRKSGTNREPFHLALNSQFLRALPDSGIVNGLERFLDEVLGRGDVYVVTLTQAMEWMRRPTHLQQLDTLESWSCSRQSQSQQPCENPSTCTFQVTEPSRGSMKPTSTAYSFKVCGSCPTNYPTPTDPLGEGRVG